MRTPVFDVIRAQRGKGFTGPEVVAIDRLLDQLGFPTDAMPAPARPPAPPPRLSGASSSARFFDHLRKSGVFGPTLKPDQVAGLETLLAAMTQAKWPIAYTAYGLATACHETAYTMQPVREAYWLSEDWRRANLRYYPHYGRGYVQLTWPENYRRADRELKLDGRLVANLDLALDPAIAADILVKGMEAGWFANHKGEPCTLARFLPGKGTATPAQFTAARRIINGTDKAGKIAQEAMHFQAALGAAGWG